MDIQQRRRKKRHWTPQVRKGTAEQRKTRRPWKLQGLLGIGELRRKKRQVQLGIPMPWTMQERLGILVPWKTLPEQLSIWACQRTRKRPGSPQGRQPKGLKTGIR
jgi:hypothetical protein